MSEKPDLTPEGIARRRAAKETSERWKWGVALLVVVVGLIGMECIHLGGGSDLNGGFVKFVPTDAGHGYAFFAITNTGDSDAKAHCTIEVTDDFGDIGIDALVDMDVPANQLVTGRIGLTVTNNAARSVTHGSVTNC